MAFVIERLQPGFGWETALMSRKPTPVGNTAGRYVVEVSVPKLPLEPGSYQVCMQLVMHGRTRSAHHAGRLQLAQWYGLALEVGGDGSAAWRFRCDGPGAVMHAAIKVSGAEQDLCSRGDMAAARFPCSRRCAPASVRPGSRGARAGRDLV